MSDFLINHAFSIALIILVTSAGIVWYRTVVLSFIKYYQNKKKSYTESFEEAYSADKGEGVKYPEEGVRKGMSELRKLAEQIRKKNPTFEVIKSLADAKASDVEEYHSQVQKMTKNLAALNSVYEMELKDAGTYIIYMNKYYETLAESMQNLSKIDSDTDKFTTELSMLTEGLANLNKVYGNMLKVMKGKEQAE